MNEDSSAEIQEPVYLRFRLPSTKTAGLRLPRRGSVCGFTLHAIDWLKLKFELILYNSYLVLSTHYTDLKAKS